MSCSAHDGTAPLGCPPRQNPAAHSARLAPITNLLACLISIFALPVSAADCLSLNQAAQHIGETKCVAGKVLNVKLGNKGVHFLDFCEDQIACPFTVVVFANDLKDIGDVRHLAGRTIEIRGALKMYDGRPEIILSRISQIEGGAAMIPPLPKSYDVETRGRFSAGRLYPGKKPRKAKPQKPGSTTTYGNDVEGDERRE
jgi:hypothetical protein